MFIPTAHAAEAAQTGIASLFGLDWKLFLAQIINFSVIVFVLWKWVLGPVSKKITERQKLALDLEEGERQLHKTKLQFQQEGENILKQARQEAGAILQTAKIAAEELHRTGVQEITSMRTQVVQEAKAEAEKIKADALVEAQSELGELVVLATSKVIGRKINTKDDLKLAQQALDQVRNV